MNVTKLELEFLNWMAQHEMTELNGASDDVEEPQDMSTFLWVDDAAGYLDISVNACKGVIGSLAKKSLIYVYTEKNPDESSVSVTDEGFAVFIANRPRKSLSEILEDNK
jgi:hypothetical protein